MTGPEDIALYPDGIETLVATVWLFITMPFDADTKLACNSPVLGLYKSLELLVYRF